MAITITALRTGLDSALTGVTHIEWSESATTGTSTGTVSTHVAATPVTTGGATIEAASDQTTYARKGVHIASPPLLSAPASAGCTITHWRFTTASTGGTAKTYWNVLSSPVVLASGGQINIGDYAIYEKITPG